MSFTTAATAPVAAQTPAPPAAPVLASVPATPGFGGLVATLRDLAAVLADGVDAGGWTALPVAVAPAVLAELFTVRDVLAAVASAGVSVVHASGALPDGHVSTKQWLIRGTGMSPTSASAELGRAAALRAGFAPTRAAALAGELSQDKVRAITTGLSTAVTALHPAARTAALDAAEAPLVDYARTATVEQVRRKIGRLRFTLDPDGADARALAAHDEQHLRFTPVGDGVAVDGLAHQAVRRHDPDLPGPDRGRLVPHPHPHPAHRDRRRCGHGCRRGRCRWRRRRPRRTGRVPCGGGRRGRT